MTRFEFEDWILKYCPPDRDHEEFIDRLAIGSIVMVEHTAKKTGLTVDELLSRFLWDDFDRKQN